MRKGKRMNQITILGIDNETEKGTIPTNERTNERTNESVLRIVFSSSLALSRKNFAS